MDSNADIVERTDFLHRFVTAVAQAQRDDTSALNSILEREFSELESWMHCYEVCRKIGLSLHG
jgi:hypothetical protein